MLASTAAVSLMRPDISSTRERRSAQGLAVSGSFFPLLGVQPALGRLFTPDDDREGAMTDVAVLEYEFWQSAYGGQNVVGQTIPLDGKPFTIIGVVQRGFFGLNVGRRFDIAIPLEGFRAAQPGVGNIGSNSLTIFGRLQPGQQMAQAQAEFRALQPALRAALNAPANLPQLHQQWDVVPLAMGLSTTAQERYRAPLMVMMAISALVLLIACANVANLLLARGAARQAEMAVRFALGASRGRVLRALVIESVSLALLGAAGGVIVGVWTARAIVKAITVNQTNNLATWIDVPLDLRMLAFTAAAGALTALIFGVGPAWWATRVDPIDAMRQRARGVVTSVARFGTAQILVAAQVAVSFVLVLGGVLLVRSFITMTTQELGFDRGQLIVATPDFMRSIENRGERIRATDRIRNDLLSQPGIDDVGYPSPRRYSIGTGMMPIEVAGHAGPDGAELREILNRVSSGYFAATGMTMLAGRDFAPLTTESANVAIVNEAFVRRYFPRTEPIGQTLRVKLKGRGQVEIIGVVRDSRAHSLRDDTAPELFLPFAPATDNSWLEITVRTSLGEEAARQAIMAAVERQAPGASAEFRTMSSGLRDAAARERAVAWLAGGFAGLALLLSAVGLYGVLAYHVVRRRHEFGVRMAVGAAPAMVMRMVLAHTAVLLAVGLGVGLAVALAAGRVIAALLYGVSATDPTMIVVAAAILSAIALLASFLPARRAAGIEPATALRED